jgi:hypothetical protein
LEDKNFNSEIILYKPINDFGLNKYNKQYLDNFSKQIKFKEVFELEKKIKDKLKESIKTKEFKELFLIKGKNYYSIIKKQAEMFSNFLPIQLSFSLLLTKKMIEETKPKCLVFLSEAGFYEKSLIQNSNNIKIISLKFGPIMEGFSDINPSIRTLPDIKIVDKKRSERILKNYYNYKSKIVIGGETRYDYIKEKFDRQKLKKKTWN